MLRRFLLSILLIWPVSAPADDGDILSRLMSEPITLFDWGLAQLDRDIAFAAYDAFKDRFGAGSNAPQAGTIYEWRTRRITLYAAIELPREERTSGDCVGAFMDIVGLLTRSAPKGPDAASWYLLHAFQPKAHFWADKFEDVGRQLLDKVQLEVTLRPATYEAVNGDTARVRCVGRLDASEAKIDIQLTS